MEETKKKRQHCSNMSSSEKVLLADLAVKYSDVSENKKTVESQVLARVGGRIQWNLDVWSTSRCSAAKTRRLMSVLSVSSPFTNCWTFGTAFNRVQLIAQLMESAFLQLRTGQRGTF